MLRLRYSFPMLILAAIAAAAGCAGRASGPAIPAVTPTPAPAIGPVTIPVGSSSAFVNLGDGSGDSAAFTLAQSSIGGSANLTISMSTTLPGSAVAPSSYRTSGGSLRPTKPKILGLGVTPIDYISVMVDNSIGISNSPSITFSLGSTSIATGLDTYLLIWDPAVAATQGWIVLDGPGTIGGASRNQVAFAGRPTGQALNAGAQYIYALVTTTAAVATASPQPAPSLMPIPAYCANYAHPSPNPSGATTYITDDSGLNVPLLAYVFNATTNKWLDANQNFTASSPVPLPAACFSTTLNSSGTVKLITPDGMGGGRWYFAYATPVPGHPELVPNPFASTPSSGPVLDYANAPYPLDFVEGGTTKDPALVIDTSQVDELGLPLDLSVAPASAPLPIRPACDSSVTSPLVVGVSSCGFANIFKEMTADPIYGQLVIAQPFNGKNYDLRILSPQQGAFHAHFAWNAFGDPSALPNPVPAPCTGATTNGYLSCLLSAYQAKPRMFTTNKTVASGATGSGDLYCVSSDGVSNFIMTDVGPGPSPVPTPVPTSPSGLCSGTYTPAPNATGAPVNPFKMPVQEFLYGIPPAKDGGGGCKLALLFSQPWGLADVDNSELSAGPPIVLNDTGHIFGTADAFALWKVMNAEILYGTALSTNEHPVGYFARGNLTPPLFAPLYSDSMYDNYDLILHKYFNNARAYGLAYDDLFDLAPTLLYHYSHAISVRINPVPVASTTSSVNTAPLPVPNDCTSLKSGIGTF